MYYKPSLLLIIAGLAVMTIGTAVAKNATEHGVIKPMPNCSMVENPSVTQDFAAYDFRISVGNDTEHVTKKGKYWFLKYRILNADGSLDQSVSAYEIVENYITAALAKGGTVHYDKNKKLTFSLPRTDGGETWAHLMASDGRYDIYIVDEAARKQQLKFGAEELALELDTSGSVAVYGIHFKIDSDRLMPGAEAVLVELVKLMINEPDLKIDISGHTDNTGSADHNQGLSERRAAAVARYLKLFGIDSSRMTTTGYGQERPVASNDTEDGRALNRRVELKKIN